MPNDVPNVILEHGEIDQIHDQLFELNEIWNGLIGKKQGQKLPQGDFYKAVIDSYPTGSRYICNPAPTDTDNDTVYLVNGYYDWQQSLLDDGWEKCGQEYEMVDDFCAFRKGEENYIVTENPDFFRDYVKATEGAKALNLLKKEDRIALFRAVMLDYT